MATSVPTYASMTSFERLTHRAAPTFPVSPLTNSSTTAMRTRLAQPWLLLLLGSVANSGTAFQLSVPTSKGQNVAPPRSFSSFLFQSTSSTSDRLAGAQEDCGCGTTADPAAVTTRFGGEPSAVARSMNPRDALRGTSVFDVNGAMVRMDDLLQDDKAGPTTSVVVFLRSLG